MTFGQRLRKYRKERKLSQNAIAELSGVSPRTIFGYEVGTTYPRTEAILNRLADALGVLKQEISNGTTGGVSFMGIYEVYPVVEGEKRRVIMFQIPAAAAAIPTGWHDHFYGITLVNKSRQIMQSVLYYRHGYDTSFEGFTGNQEDHQGAGHSPA